MLDLVEKPVIGEVYLRLPPIAPRRPRRADDRRRGGAAGVGNSRPMQALGIAEYFPTYGGEGKYCPAGERMRLNETAVSALTAAVSALTEVAGGTNNTLATVAR